MTFGPESEAFRITFTAEAPRIDQNFEILSSHDLVGLLSTPMRSHARDK
jgi:hypothetical protein